MTDENALGAGRKIARAATGVQLEAVGHHAEAENGRGESEIGMAASLYEGVVGVIFEENLATAVAPVDHMVAEATNKGSSKTGAAVSQRGRREGGDSALGVGANPHKTRNVPVFPFFRDPRPCALGPSGQVAVGTKPRLKGFRKNFLGGVGRDARQLSL